MWRLRFPQGKDDGDVVIKFGGAFDILVCNDWLIRKSLHRLSSDPEIRPMDVWPPQVRW